MWKYHKKSNITSKRQNVASTAGWKTIRLYSNFSLSNGWDEIRKNKQQKIKFYIDWRKDDLVIAKYESDHRLFLNIIVIGNSFWFTLKIKLLLSKQKSSTLQIYKKLAVIYIILLGSTFFSFFLEAVTFLLVMATDPDYHSF